MKTLYKTVLATYVLGLLWLVLFKFSVDIPGVLDHQMRSLSLIPFTGGAKEMMSNLVVFIPLGLLLSVNFKRADFWQKLAFISIFSLAVELIQFVLAIGVSDITDVITNTLGGSLGLALYDFNNKYMDTEQQNRCIIMVVMFLLILVMMLRFFVFRVRY
jgi:glycopeptide antibiotics resistance protein